MPKVKKDNVKHLITGVNFSQKVDEYHLMNTQKKALENNMDKLKSSLKAYVQKAGTKNDTGSFIIETKNLVIEERAVKKIEPSLEKVIAQFAHKPEVISEVVKVRTYLDEEALERLLEQGTITAEEVESICDITTNYSFYVTPKEEIPEVLKSSVSSAAALRRKPMLKPKKKA